ncbi:type 1 glutamine amidotransferase [Compostimonas suwonensis]|uniref:Lipid II isoglutaminyl synthase (glutamine-hydrolyzing) subunit GatD n=1 Tax=Compostimonas suwonensis TaxID=1048394 RepID=A0A2M9BBK8_9MICO|nr:glutamine amidotransferase [Compostimonas suwonensis]PJJ55330.1 hypothetical protein CLV54_3220 [Compostimonas suwonensis]
MSDILTVVSVLPALLDTNGDASNARVLARRAGWAGFEARVVEVSTAAELPERVDLVVLGSGADAEFVDAIDAAQPLRSALQDWIDEGVPLLAVGTGWELLSAGVDDRAGAFETLGLLPGRAVARTRRVSDDLVVESGFGRLIGYENHAHDYLLPEGVSPLGTVRVGSGNGDAVGGAGEGVAGAARGEGLVQGSAIGTHLHGPVLAKNPSLADHLLGTAIERSRGVVYETVSAEARHVDDIARAARNRIAVRLELGIES